MTVDSYVASNLMNESSVIVSSNQIRIESMCSLSLFSGDLMEEFYGALCIKKAKIILTDICTLLFLHKNIVE